MPYPAQVQVETLAEKARELIESEGLDRLTLSALASAFGIAAPSLYHHFKNKTALLQAVNMATAAALTEHVSTAVAEAVAAGQDGRAAILAMAHAYRAFAHANPATYSLLYANQNPDLRVDPRSAEALALPLQAAMAAVVGAAESLAALRGAWALIHGFVMLEIGGQFQRGGDLDAAFTAAVRAYIAGWKV